MYIMTQYFLNHQKSQIINEITIIRLLDDLLGTPYIQQHF